MTKQDPPVFLDLAAAMGLEPELPAPKCHWEPWLLEDQYPPTVGELVKTLDPPPPMLFEVEEADGPQGS